MKFYKVRDMGPDFNNYHAMFSDGGNIVEVFIVASGYASQYAGEFEENEVCGIDTPFRDLPHDLQVEIVNIERAYTELG